MRRLREFALGLALCVLPAAPAAQSGLGVADVIEIRAVIDRQLEAFGRDDAEQAFALASPGLRQAFRSAESFLDAIRTSYRPVYRPASRAFLDLWILDGEVVQQLRITEHSGRVWHAFYVMERQRDGTWRTGGCNLVRQQGLVAT
jgi:hypothetical protein